MPTLLELQQAMRQSLVAREDGAAAAMLAMGCGPERLDIYRNSFIIGVTNALRLTCPAVHRLVGDDFFAAAAQACIAAHPPQAAWLDGYGADFAEFLEQFPPAAALVYLGDVARLEWAVSQAIHARDCPPLALTALVELAPGEEARVRFLPHPSISLLRVAYPVDDIWRAVLARDDGALAALALDRRAVHLLVQRLPAGVEVTRLDEAHWRFLAALCAGEPLQDALDKTRGVDALALLAAHLAADRFVGFTLTSAHPNLKAGAS
jgi:hypothetical protein